MTSLPTREEIAQIIYDHHFMAATDALDLADALLARLRPAWESPMNYTPTIETIRRKMKGGSLFAEDEIAVLLKEIDALRADLQRMKQYLYEAQNPMLPNGETITVGEMYEKWQNAEKNLRACVEALETILPAMDSILRWIESHKGDLKELTDADFDGFRDSVNDAHAALARPGVQRGQK